MSTPDPGRTGLLPYAFVWSWICMGIAIVGGIVLATIDLVEAITVDEVAVTSPLHGTLIAALVCMFLASVFTNISARVIWHQRRIFAQLEAMDRTVGPEPDPVAAPERINGLTPDMVETARVISRRLHNAS